MFSPMKLSLHSISLFLALFSSTVVAQVPLPPANDPFYQPPSGFTSSPPGTVLRSRRVEVAVLGLVPEPFDAYQLLYRTTAVNGSAIATVTTIFRPENAYTDRFVSFQTAEDSSSSICAPSYNYQLAAAQTDLIITVEDLLLQAYLASGYIVSSPDYEGPDSAFGAGHLEGMGVLDGMRATRNFASNLSMSYDAAIVGSGYSGGAIATGWAASLERIYAPELNIKGWASGGTPANMTGTFVFLDGTVFSGFLPVGIDGLNKPSSYFAQIEPIVQQYITAYGKQKLAFADDNECAVEDIFDFTGQKVLAYSFNTLGPQLPYQPVVAAVLGEQTMGIHQDETPVAPVFLYHARQDEIIPYDNATTLYYDWCAEGASVQFLTYGNGGHFTTEILGIVPALQFIAEAFAGNVSAGCSRSVTLNNTLDPIALGVDLEPITVHLIDALELLGNEDINLIRNITILNETV